jgi:ABC-2 type transport system ATP-binding protein
MKLRALVLALTITALLPIHSVAAEVTSKSQQTAPGVFIDTSIYLPKKTPAPAILLAHGFGGSKDSVVTEAQAFQKRGYVVMTWTARGFGKSTGQISMNSLSAEIADVQQLITTLGKRKDVLQDRTGDPVVGIAGGSYGGAAALLTASQDKRIDAVVADITWNDLSQALFPQSSSDLAEAGPFKKIWTGTFFALATLQSAYLGECGSLTNEWCSAYKSAVMNGQPSAAERKLLRSVSPVSFLSSIKAPTLLSQGQADSLFPLNESSQTAAVLKKNGVPLSMIWHAAGHDGGADEKKYLQEQYSRWFDKHLLKQEIDFPLFQFTKTNGSISLQDSTAIPKSFTATRLPFEAEMKKLPLLAQPAAMSYPVGGIPSAISSLPGIGSAGSLAATVASSFAGFSPAFVPGQSGFLDSAVLKEPISVTGSSRIKVRVTSTTGEATLFFSLVTKSPSGAISQPNGIVAPIRLTNIPADGRDITVTLPAVILDAAIGDTVAIGISSTDQGYELPKSPAFYSVTALSPLEYPVINALPAAGSSANWLWPILALLTLVGAIVLVYIRRPRPSAQERDEDFLVQVENLSKTYKDGYRAVDDLSFTVSRGQVVGLLGPNGAGKTTTLRMLMGLIFPTEGSIYMDGKAVYPGSPALANLGSFVEGPGFLPHLTGRENLDLYWKSIGRSGDKYLDEVISITKLGTALDKKVRSYSQGMRQRLAIAQAMLGMPDLLVLDEPTNGLDPQQIAEMRQVLKDYAKTGRTVIVSSHLLAEVQQTCSHVVLMHRGKLIAFGPMKKILTKNRQARSLEEIFLELIGDDLVIGKELS